MAGARIGYIAADKAVIANLRRLELAVPPSTISLEMARFALQHHDYFEEYARDVVAGRDFLRRQLNDVGVRTCPSGGNFLLIPNLTLVTAEKIVESVRQRGYAIKGPLSLDVFGTSVRVTTGRLMLMQSFWTDVKDIFMEYAKN